MAIFERRHNQPIQLDDTQTVNCVIETAQDVDGHTEYVLRLQRGPHKENTWKLLRRYNDFALLDKSLSHSGIRLPMPGKRYIGNMRPEFVAERRLALQEFINVVLMNPILASSLPAKRFVDPDSYSQSFHDQAVQNASLCLRNDSHWALGTSLGAIGWRLRKHYFKVTSKPPDKAANKLLVKSGSQSAQQQQHQQQQQQQQQHQQGSGGKHGSSTAGGSNGSGSMSGGHSLDGNMPDVSELVVEYIEYGPDKWIDDKELNGIMKSLMALQHPHIEPVVCAMHNENGGLVIRKFYKHGTLKDILCMATPKNPFLSKYGNPKGRTALTMKQLASYGRQILEALTFLHAKGYPYGHLHSGNIVIVDDCIKLLDIENYILGVPAFYRPFFVQHSKIHTVEAIDVYCFGHVLFEMAMGYPLQESVVRQISECPETLKNLLESILSKECVRAGLPTLEQLLAHQFFAQPGGEGSGGGSGSDDSNKPHFKLSLNAKELIKQAAQKCENRLQNEQKSVKNQKRIVRVQELMSSEEEKRKTKHKAKLEHKQSKLKQQGSLQANNGRLSLSSMSGTAAGQSVMIGGMAPFNRTDSVLSVHLSQDATTSSSAAAFADLKSPPLTPAAPHEQQHHYNQQQQQHFQHQHNFHHQQQQQHQQPHSQKQITSLASVDRQSSTPNISSDDQSEPGRSALLESICKFNRGSLRKVRSND